MRLGAISLALTIVVVACTSTDLSEPIRDQARSGVGIIATGCGLAATSGSGAAIGSDGMVVTVAHTLRGAKQVSVIDADGTEHEARVRAFDKDLDLAVVSAETLEVPELQLGDVSVGAGSALVWSRDEGVRQIDVDVTKRLTVTIEDIYGDGRVRRSAVEVDAEIEIGDSGGPVLDDAGRVVGIIYAASRQRPGVGFAVDATEIAAVVAMVDDSDADTGRCP